MHAEIIELNSIRNCRDLGFITNKDGYKIKKHMLFRSGGFYNGEKDIVDLQELYDNYNLRHIIDLRSSFEKLENPDPLYKDIKYFDLVVQEGRNTAIEQDEEAIRLRNEYFEQLRIKCNESNEYAKNHMCGFYSSIVESHYSINAYKQFLNYLLEAEGGVLWHCALGRDRTGVASILILLLLDVNITDIYDDYLYSNIFLYKPEGISEYYATAHSEYLDALFEAIQGKYQSIEGLFSSMNIDKTYRERFKRKYLDNY